MKKREKKMVVGFIQKLKDAKEDCESEKDAHKLEHMLEDHRTSLYPGCEQGHKKLDTTLEFLQWKAKNSVSNKVFGDLLKLVKNILSEGNKFPETTYEAKKIVCPLGLEVQKIHACLNDCILYRGEEYEKLEACPVCKALRYKIRRDDPGEVDGQPMKKKILAKRKYIMMPIIIQGAKQHGNDINVYLRPLFKDLKLLWKKEGVSVWDEDKHEEFNLRALLFVTINDWPTLSNLSGQSNKGYKACTHCMDETERKQFAMVKDLKVVFGKGPGSQPIESEDSHAAMWKKNSIFWELPYWEFLDVRHAIDVMHLTKNLCVNLLGFLAVYGKSKDTLEARKDLKHIEQRGDLHPEPKEKGSHYLSPASYTLSKAEKEKIGILGPVYLHNMFPFKRYMSVLKNYVRNRARLEASIAKGYGAEEVIEFCVEFIEDLRPIGVPESRHKGRLQGKGTLGRKAIMTVDNNLFRKAHFTVLQQSSLVAPYIEEHLALVRARNIAQDMKSTNQNSAIHIDAMGHDGTTGTYYGAIEDIWELDYGPLKVPLFWCQWVRLTGGGVTIDDSGMSTVDLNKVGYSDEPFILANNVTQVFYVKDMSSKGKKGKGPDEPKRHVVLPGKRKIVGVEDKIDEDYDQFDGQPSFTVRIDASILLSNEDTLYSRSDHKEGTIVRRKYVWSTVTVDVLP
uniref:Transposon protein, putative, CACTA, En/Spm sub-class n=2 Tax=Oryza sativa subsp. japonica TaxID=39947 RepID=Q53MR8_ORYSJ|nr:transposon protein, putative, CACTA, En/Spm sub-class [Oryza sativa Japonica Group]ABA92833.1 transposon protein, putative, CACTA, En/Spm sub-class [Oryza sativa Japonica Group]